MAAFIITALVLTAAVLLVIFWGSRRQDEEASDEARVGTNLAALRAEYAQAEADRKAGKLTEEEYEELRGELESRVLEETRESERIAASDRRQRLGTYAFVALFVPIAAGIMYWRFGTWDAFNPAIAQMQAASQGGHSMAEIDAQLAALEQNLQKNPDDVNGWMLFARTNDALKRFDKAAAAYEKLVALVDSGA